MKYRTFIDKEHEEEVLIYAKEKNSLVTEIENLCESDSISFTGTNEREIVKISPLEIVCFISENNKVFALIDDKKISNKTKTISIRRNGF
jgi:glycyl-tRNA synthetase beta subunit